MSYTDILQIFVSIVGTVIDSTCQTISKLSSLIENTELLSPSLDMIDSVWPHPHKLKMNKSDNPFWVKMLHLRCVIARNQTVWSHSYELPPTLVPSKTQFPRLAASRRLVATVQCRHLISVACTIRLRWVHAALIVAHFLKKSIDPYLVRTSASGLRSLSGCQCLLRACPVFALRPGSVHTARGRRALK